MVAGAKTTEIEYLALIEGLRKAIALGISELEIRGDSETVLKQVLGKARANKEHRAWLLQVNNLLDLMPSYTVRWVPREENEAHHVSSAISFTSSGGIDIGGVSG